jgi:ribosomal protein S18 acetylase RimI-like enzyme
MSSFLRELREEDAAQVAALFVEAFGEARRLDAEEIRSWLRNDELKPEWLQVLEEDGRVVGYGDVWVQDDMVALDVAAPGHWGPFFDWAEELARQRGLQRVRAYFPAGHELAAFVTARSYRLARSSYTMEIELRDAPARPQLPGSLALQPYREDADEEGVRSAVNESFAEDWYFHPVSESNFREFYLKARGYDPSLWLLARDGDEIAGLVLAYADRVGEEGLGWVGTLAVRPRWRRRGLGEALLRAAFEALYERGRRRVGLGVDAENVTGALRLYERVGMRVIRQSDNWVREL